MEVIETVTTETKLKKKAKKKKSTKLNNNHCETEEKSVENGDVDTNIKENLIKKIDELCINKQKNGLKLVNGVEHKEKIIIENKHFEIQQEKTDQSECKLQKDEPGASSSNCSKKVGSKKKKNNKKQKEPDKVVSEDVKSSVTIHQQTSESTTTDDIHTTSEEKSLEPKIVIDYNEYESELQMPDIMHLIQKDLSEPYSIYTYRYFIHNWPKLCFLAMHNTKCVGAIVCKLDMHKMVRRGYIAMLAVDKDYRKLKIGTTLVQKAIEAMLRDSADEVVLETEITNRPALKLYENLGFVRDKRLFHYYLNGVDALRLKLWFR